MNEEGLPRKSIGEQRQEVELKKLQLELAQISKPWWKKASTVVPLLLVLGTLLTGILTGWFENEYKLIELKRHTLEREKQTLRQQELSFQVTLRLDMLFRDKDLSHPENPSANALIALLQKDIENRQFYTRLMVNHLNTSNDLTERLMILYILHQGTLTNPVQQVPDLERWRWPNSEWTRQFFELVEENWERPELDRIIQFGDWHHYDPFIFLKWIELIGRQIDQIGDRAEAAERSIARAYYRTLPDSIVGSELPDKMLERARYVFTHVAGLETGLVSHEIFGFINVPSYLVKRKAQAIERFARFLNRLYRLDEIITINALAAILHQVKIGPEKAQNKLAEPLGKLFTNLRVELTHRLGEIGFPAYDSDRRQLDMEKFNELGRKAYLGWLIKRTEGLTPQQIRLQSIFWKLLI